LSYLGANLEPNFGLLDKSTWSFGPVPGALHNQVGWLPPTQETGLES
jgi:hypothetical protein